MTSRQQKMVRVLRTIAVAGVPLVLGCHSPAAPSRPGSSAAGYQLTMLAASCWFGGVWDDIYNQPPEKRKEAVEARCQIGEGPISKLGRAVVCAEVRTEKKKRKLDSQ